MTQPMNTQNESSTTTRPGAYNESSLGITQQSIKAFCKVDAIQNRQRESLSLDELFNELNEEFPGFGDGVESARKDIGNTFYAEESSLKALRMKRGWSQSTLAEKMNSSQAQIAKIESGKIDTQLTTICRLADIFGITIGEMAEAVADNYKK